MITESSLPDLNPETKLDKRFIVDKSMSYLFAKYLNAKIPPRAKRANPKVNFSIPESSPTRPSCFRCLKCKIWNQTYLYLIQHKETIRKAKTMLVKTSLKTRLRLCNLQTLKSPTILLEVCLMISWHVQVSSGF